MIRAPHPSHRRSSMPSRPAATVALLLSVAAWACGGQKDDAKPAPGKVAPGGSAASAEKKAEPAIPQLSPAAVLEQVKPLFSPLPPVAEDPSNPLTEEKIELGRMLYYDPRLSKGQDISCNTCHDLEHYGVDIREQNGKRPAVSLGHENQAGERNSPTVYNAGLQVAQFWDGRADSLEEQAKGPILNPVEMAMPDEATVVKTLAAIPGYKEKFAAAFPGQADPITYDNVAAAIGAFERRLMTPAPFDEFLSGKMTALDDKQLWGLQLFVEVGCTQCHNAAALGGTQFQKLGNVKPWPTADEGRFGVTNNEADKGVFKVPPLRNVAETAPYLHDGSIETLEEMVQMMAEHQSARGRLPQAEVDAIVAFLGTLTGEIPKEYIAKPELPGLSAAVAEKDPA